MPDLGISVSDRIATITLNRPDRRNAFTLEMIDAWADALDRFATDDSVHVVLVRGAGGDFCAGADLGDSFSQMGESPYEQKEALRRHVHRIPLTLERFDKPVIAAINGVAFGAGLDLALMADLRIAGTSVRLCESYVNVGMMPGAGAAYLLPRQVGRMRAIEMLLTGDVIGGEEAHRIGLVTRLVADEDVEGEATELAARLAAGPQIAIRMLKRLIRQSAEIDLATALELASSQMALIRTTEDSVEAISSFRERREPVYKNR
jgi:enoyl-CoA hydratase/carnithine racemase